MENKFISYLQLFTSISIGDQKIICDAFELKSFSEGEYLFESGGICKEMFFITEGVLKITVNNEKGVRVIHYFLKENQFCTILQSFQNGTTAEESIVAASDVEVQSITKTKLSSLYKKIPYLEKLIDQITQQRLLDKIKIRNTYLGHDSAARYRLFLMQQSDIAMRVSLSDVASYLEITPQSLSRIRRNQK
jgi:CRP-like cAMP-binding protein